MTIQTAGIEAHPGRAADDFRPTDPAKRLHVAIVDEELPYPPVTGKRIRTLNLIRRLARRHRITYFCHRGHDAAETRQAVRHFDELGIETILDRTPAPQQTVLTGRLRLYTRLARNLLSPRPYLVDVHCSDTLCSLVEEYAKHNEVDLWQCEWTPYAETLRGLPNKRWLVMAHNVESLIWQRYCETERRRLKRWYIGLQWRKFERYERWAFNHSTRAVTVSPEDAELARQRFGAKQIDVVDNGVDTSVYRPSRERRHGKAILFLGSLDWRPNLDAVEQLLDAVLPAVHAREPAARLWIVGRRPPGWLVDKVRHLSRVELHADVPDVLPFLHRCTVMAVPLRIGGGSRLKILEALATETPVVSTRVGAEGLALESGKHLVTVEGIEQIAEALVESLRHPGPMEEMARRGRRVVTGQYDWDVLAGKLEQVWASCVAN